eukprot:4356513-Amphidinium_carterae.1
MSKHQDGVQISNLQHSNNDSIPSLTALLAKQKPNLIKANNQPCYEHDSSIVESSARRTKHNHLGDRFNIEDDALQKYGMQ